MEPSDEVVVQRAPEPIEWKPPRATPAAGAISADDAKWDAFYRREYGITRAELMRRIDDVTSGRAIPHEQAVQMIRDAFGLSPR